MSDSDFAASAIGSVLSGRWRLDALLGTGGMASVYAGTHTRNRMRVAIKVLHPEVGRSPQLRERFLREGYVANSIKHPGIVKVFDDSADNDTVYLVMDLLEGKTLKEAWSDAERAMPVAETGRIISSMLDILAAAHRAGVVHRDIKPDNVFLTNDGAVKVLDFGIAGVRELQSTNEHATATGTTLGTPAFMPPEQALGRWSEVDARSDLFSVAATAWLLLTGRLPHDAKGVSELLVAAATRRMRPIASVAPAVPPALARVIDQALSFEREARFGDAEEMKRAWDQALGSSVRSETMVMPALADVGDLDEAAAIPRAPRVTHRITPPVTQPPRTEIIRQSSPLSTEPNRAATTEAGAPTMTGPDPTSVFVTPAASAITGPNPHSSHPFRTETPVSHDPLTRRVKAKVTLLTVGGMVGGLGAVAIAALFLVNRDHFVNRDQGVRPVASSAAPLPEVSPSELSPPERTSNAKLEVVSAPTAANSPVSPTEIPSSAVVPPPSATTTTEAPVASSTKKNQPPINRCAPKYDAMLLDYRCCGNPCH